MTNQSAQIVSFTYPVRDDDTSISELSEAEAVWVARKEAAWLLNQVTTDQIAKISESYRQCIRSIKGYLTQLGRAAGAVYPPPKAVNRLYTTNLPENICF